MRFPDLGGDRMREAGFSLVELLVVAGLIATTGAMAVPHLLVAMEDTHTSGAARYVSAQLQRARMEALGRSTHVALRFSQTGSGYSYAVYVDGNGNGVRSADINQGIDRQLGAQERLPDQFEGVDFGLLPGLPPVEPGGAAPGTDPIKLGSSEILSFSATGTSSSGSLYIRGRESAQYVVRVFGDTARIRILRFDAQAGRWMPL